MPNLYVGNLDLDTSESQLRNLFETCGMVDTVRIFKTPGDVGHAYAWVEMTNDGEAQSAINTLHMTLLGRRLLSIETRAQAPRVRQFPQ